MLRSPKKICPASTGSSPAMTLSSVDLPMPDSPRIATYSPSRSSSEIWFRTDRPPKRLPTATSLSTLESYYVHRASRPVVRGAARAGPRAQKAPRARARRADPRRVGRPARRLAREGAVIAGFPRGTRERLQHQRRNYHARFGGRARLQVFHARRRHGPRRDDGLAESRRRARSIDISYAAVGGRRR